MGRMDFCWSSYGLWRTMSVELKKKKKKKRDRFGPLREKAHGPQWSRRPESLKKDNDNILK